MVDSLVYQIQDLFRREFTDFSVKHVISVELVLGDELPVAILFELLDWFFIDIFLCFIKLGCKDSKTSDFEAIMDLLEDYILEVDDVVDQRVADNEIVHTDELFWQ